MTRRRTTGSATNDTVSVTARWPKTPMLDLTFTQRFRTKRVQRALAVIERVCAEVGGTIERILEGHHDGTWWTSVTVLSRESYRDESAAKAWWTNVRDRFLRELPHQDVLERPLAQQNYAVRFPASDALAARISRAFAQAVEDREDRDLSRG